MGSSIMVSVFKVIDNVIKPKFNPYISNGYVMTRVDKFIHYVDHAIKLASKQFPEGLVYEGYKLCKPKEEFDEMTAPKQGRIVELSKSTVYMIYIYFSLNGKMLGKRALYLPYFTQGGSMWIRGKKPVVLPVLADPAISVSGRELFVHLTSVKVTFKRLPYYYVIDGVKKDGYVTYSKLHNHDPKTQSRAAINYDDSIKAEHALMFYLLSKYGLSGTFQRFLNTDIIAYEEDFPEDRIPVGLTKDDFVICESLKIRPNTVKMLPIDYVSTKIKLAIPKSVYYLDYDKDSKSEPIANEIAAGFVIGFYYIADHFPHRISLHDVNSTALWRALLGHAVYMNNASIGKLQNDIDVHIASVDTYLDVNTIEALAEDDVHVDDIYQLMVYIIQNFSRILLNTDVGSSYGKILMVERYLLSDIVEAINKMKYQLTSTNGREVKENNITKNIGRFIQPEIIFKLVKADHPEVVFVDGSCDSYAISNTHSVILQDAVARAKSRVKKNVSLHSKELQLHVSNIEIGSILSQSKSDITGRSKLNPYQKMSPNGRITHNPKFTDLLKSTSEKISR